jgi:hypothetical protein
MATTWGLVDKRSSGQGKGIAKGLEQSFCSLENLRGRLIEKSPAPFLFILRPG